MRLLRSSSDLLWIEAEEFNAESFPEYAILSHTWGDDEVTLQEFKSPSISTTSKSGFHKIRSACSEARTRDKLEYTWVDTCCIDKTSSAELTEAINSMYAWYARASVCYAYLSDLEPGTAEDLEEALPKCRWFERGWTLQELIAPRRVVFFDRDWNMRGNKNDMSQLLCQITGIPVELLQSRESLGSYSVAQRMSWASRRKTTRTEDTAYCLLGIFDVNLSLIYGEGKKAFYRLQEAIVLSTADRSIFLWTENRPDAPRRILAPILAEEPFQFADCGNVSSAMEDTLYRQFTTNTRGLQVQASLVADPTQADDAYKCILDTDCTDGERRVAIAIRKIGTGRYARYKPDMIATVRDESKTITLLTENIVNRKLVETVTLATSIDLRTPFPGRNVIIGNRCGALRVNWLDKPLKLSINYHQCMPRSNWDYHDEVFFSSTTLNKSWCAYLARGVVKLTEDRCIPIHVLVLCGYWNIGKPKVIVASLHDINSATVALLEAHLERMPFERARQVFTLVVTALDGKVPKSLTSDEPVKTGKAVIRTFETKGDRIHSLHPTRQDDADGVVNVEVNAEVHPEDRPDICSYSMWRLDIRCRILEEPPPME